MLISNETNRVKCSLMKFQSSGLHKLIKAWSLIRKVDGLGVWRFLINKLIYLKITCELHRMESIHSVWYTAWLMPKTRSRWMCSTESKIILDFLKFNQISWKMTVSIHRRFHLTFSPKWNLLWNSLRDSHSKNSTLRLMEPLHWMAIIKNFQSV